MDWHAKGLQLCVEMVCKDISLGMWHLEFIICSEFYSLHVRWDISIDGSTLSVNFYAFYWILGLI
jgi:hypothetical protein